MGAVRREVWREEGVCKYVPLWASADVSHIKAARIPFASIAHKNGGMHSLCTCDSSHSGLVQLSCALLRFAADHLFRGMSHNITDDDHIEQTDVQSQVLKRISSAGSFGEVCQLRSC